jgi:hypothetical protein
MSCAPSLDMARNSRSPRLSMNVTSLMSTTHVRPLRFRTYLFQRVLSSPIQGPTRRPCRIHHISVGFSLEVIFNTSAFDHLEAHAITFQNQKRRAHVGIRVRTPPASVRPCGRSTHQLQPSAFHRSDQPPHRSSDAQPSGRGCMRQPPLYSDRLPTGSLGPSVGSAPGSRECGTSEGTRPAHRSWS